MQISTEQIANLLKSTRIFTEVDDEILERLADRTEVENFEKGDTIFEKGDSEGKAYLVFRGKVGIYRDGFLMANYTNENIFAEFSMLDGSSYNASAKAEEDCTLVSLSRKHFLEAIRENISLAESVIKNLSLRLKRHL